MWEQPVDKTGNEKDEVEELHPCKTEEPLENRSFKEECDYAVKLFENGSVSLPLKSQLETKGMTNST